MSAANPQDARDAAHHFVPKFYLKGFTDKERTLWVYEKGLNAPRQSAPKKEGCIQNYYTFNERGYADDQAENMLARTETIVAPLIRKLANPLFEMDELQRGQLFTFVALTYVRVPAYRQFIDKQAEGLIRKLGQQRAAQPEAFYATVRAYEAKTGEVVGDPEQLRQFVLGDDYTITQNSMGFNLGQTFSSCLTINKVLESQYSYDIYYAPSGMYFLTSDNPIVTIEPDSDDTAYVGGGFGRPKTEVIFPLNKRACLILRRKGRQARDEASRLRTNQINDMVMGVAQKYAYGPEGTRRIARIYNERGCRIRYGENAFMAQPPPG